MSDPANVVPIEKASTATTEIGASGLAISGGRIRDEFLPNLKGQNATRTFREMRDNDAIVGALLFAIDMLLREVEWHAVPADDTDQRAADEAEFLWSCVGDMSLTWPQLISAILSFLPYGWSFFETVYKRRTGPGGDAASRFDDGRVGWRKHALRTQESLLRWEFDENGGVQAFVQTTSSGQKTIPIEKGLLFRTSVARGNPEGRSILRNAYRPWYFKKRIEEIEAIGTERDLAGLPVAGVPPAYLDANATDSQKQLVEKISEILRDIRTDDQSSVVWPRDIDPDTKLDRWELRLLTTGGRRAFDTDAIVGRYAQHIAMTVLADFILLGNENVGAYSLGTSKVEMFTTALAAFLDEVQSVFNDYAIPRLMALNGVPETLWPTLAHDDVRRVDLKELGDYVTALSTAGVPLDDALEAHLREVGGLPQRDAEATSA